MFCCRHLRRVAMSAAAVADAPAPAAPPALPYRVGHGFDLHRLAEGYKLIIGGVEIPHTKGCEAHSDGACIQQLGARHAFCTCGLLTPATNHTHPPCIPLVCLAAAKNASLQQGHGYVVAATLSRANVCCVFVLCR